LGFTIGNDSTSVLVGLAVERGGKELPSARKLQHDKYTSSRVGQQLPVSPHRAHSGLLKQVSSLGNTSRVALSLGLDVWSKSLMTCVGVPVRISLPNGVGSNDELNSATGWPQQNKKTPFAVGQQSPSSSRTAHAGLSAQVATKGFVNIFDGLVVGCTASEVGLKVVKSLGVAVVKSLGVAVVKSVESVVLSLGIIVRIVIAEGLSEGVSVLKRDAGRVGACRTTSGFSVGMTILSRLRVGFCVGKLVGIKILSQQFRKTPSVVGQQSPSNWSSVTHPGLFVHNANSALQQFKNTPFSVGQQSPSTSSAAQIGLLEHDATESIVTTLLGASLVVPIVW
jgi:hypothetical protein